MNDLYQSLDKPPSVMMINQPSEGKSHDNSATKIDFGGEISP